MIALLSGAWWAQRLAGIIPQAIGIAAFVTVAIGIVTGGLAWLRHDARADEASGWTVRLANARVQDASKAAIRQRASEAIGQKKQQELLTEVLAMEAAKVRAEAKLAAMKANPVCWPKAVVGDMNR